MEKKIFISYSDLNRKEMQRIQIAISKSKYLVPIVVANKRQAMIPLAEKVAENIESCEIIVPILTQDSIKNQWVNQEIGYAKARNKRIIPIIEKSIINDLKGFINKELDLSYNYNLYPENLKKERKSFRLCYKKLLLDIEAEIITTINKPLLRLEGSSKLYLKEGNLIRHMPDRTTRTLLGYTDENIQTITTKKFKEFKFGEPLPSVRKAELLIFNRAIYALLEDSLHHIPNEETLEYIQQYNKNPAREITQDIFDKYKFGKGLKTADELRKSNLI